MAGSKSDAGIMFAYFGALGTVLWLGIWLFDCFLKLVDPNTNIPSPPPPSDAPSSLRGESHQPPEQPANRDFFHSSYFVGWVAVAVAYLVGTISMHLNNTSAYENWAAGYRASSPTVYISFTGKRYHTSGHSGNGYLARQLFDAVRSRYTPCQTCNPPTVSVADIQKWRKEPSYFGYGVFFFIASAIYLGATYNAFSRATPGMC